MLIYSDQLLYQSQEIMKQLLMYEFDFDHYYASTFLDSIPLFFLYPFSRMMSFHGYFIVSYSRTNPTVKNLFGVRLASLIYLHASKA